MQSLNFLPSKFMAT